MRTDAGGSGGEDGRVGCATRSSSRGPRSRVAAGSRTGSWARLSRRILEVNPLWCRVRGGDGRGIVITEPRVVEGILGHVSGTDGTRSGSGRRRARRRCARMTRPCAEGAGARPRTRWVGRCVRVSVEGVTEAAAADASWPRVPEGVARRIRRRSEVDRGGRSDVPGGNPQIRGPRAELDYNPLSSCLPA